MGRTCTWVNISKCVVSQALPRLKKILCTKILKRFILAPDSFCTTFCIILGLISSIFVGSGLSKGQKQFYN